MTGVRGAQRASFAVDGRSTWHARGGVLAPTQSLSCALQGRCYLSGSSRDGTGGGKSSKTLRVVAPG